MLLFATLVSESKLNINDLLDYCSHCKCLSGSGCKTHFLQEYNFCANRSAYKNAYQIIILMKNFPKKNKSCTGCIAWHGILHFSKILEEP
jgi:hypothetical protein